MGLVGWEGFDFFLFLFTFYVYFTFHVYFTRKP